MLTLILSDQGYAPVPEGHLKRNMCSVIGGNSNHFHKEKQLFFDTLLDEWVEKMRQIIVATIYCVQRKPFSIIVKPIGYQPILWFLPHRLLETLNRSTVSVITTLQPHMQRTSAIIQQRQKPKDRRKLSKGKE